MDLNESKKKRKFSRRNITEEDMAEYMANKAMKVAKKLNKSRKTVLKGYYSNNNSINPFREYSNLSEKFIWMKKIEHDIAHGVPLYDVFSVKAEKERQKERMAEIDRVVKRRRRRGVEEKAIAKEAQQVQVIDHELLSRNQETEASKPAPPSEDNLESKALKAMGAMEDGDAIFGGPGAAEVNLENSSEVSYKYRPRKPRHLNRFRTGYVWNKYNRTHYDSDNPPPKFVQGYKFNIFYPELIDKTKSPIYTIEKDGNSTETCIIRFHAGPPYEDIGFRIVNGDWDYSHKKGFRCKFEHDGLLQVYFNFKRYSYHR